MQKVPVLFMLFASIASFSLFSCEAKGQQSVVTVEKIDEANKLRYTDYKKSLNVLSNYFTQSLNTGDTALAIICLRNIAGVHGHHAEYKKSYDILWKALRLARQSGNKLAESTLYADIGRKYGFYKREDKAYSFLQKSLEVRRELLKAGLVDKSELVSSFYALCSVSREFKKFKQAQQYLDSCYLYAKQTPNTFQYANLKLEEAVIQSENGKYNSAIDTFNEIKPIFEKEAPGYNVLTETYQGVAHLRNGQLIEAENNFRSALKISEQYDSHLDFANLAHEYLSDVYFRRGNFPMAYQEMKKVKELDFKFFDSRSANNRNLLEIQDELRVEQENAANLKQQQKVRELQDAKKILFLQRSLLILAILGLIAIGYIYIKYLRNRFKSEKAIAKKRQELEIKQVNDLIDIKNKEMAVTSLKLIEKDEMIDDFKKTVEKGNWEMDPAKLKRAVKSLEVNHNQIWEEFETRFISVNSDFYKNLHREFPELSVTDDKLCALIKLNFNSKAMSKLLGISTESVHTARYRLRKKLGLDRNDNLTDFIAKF